MNTPTLPEPETTAQTTTDARTTAPPANLNGPPAATLELSTSPTPQLPTSAPPSPNSALPSSATPSSVLSPPPSGSPPNSELRSPNSELPSPSSGTPPSSVLGPPSSGAVQSVGILGTVDLLSPTERSAYDVYEAIMSTGWNTFIDVGLALAAIRDQRLYREEYDTFEDYCRLKWEYGRRYVNRLIIAAQLVNHLGSIWPQNKPHRESQLRPLIGLTPEQAQLVWECARQMAGDGKITARIVKLTVKELGFEAEKAKPAQPPRPNRTQQRRAITSGFGELLTLLRQRAAHATLLEKAEALHAQVQAFFPVLKAKSKP